MDIASLSMSMSQNNLMSAVGTKMLSNSIDLMESQNAMLADTISATATPSLESLVYPTQGTAIDITV